MEISALPVVRTYKDISASHPKWLDEGIDETYVVEQTWSDDALADLKIACRTGDLDKIRTYVEVDGIPVNTRDKWNAVPLYYASLCGQADVVKYLLAKGARCEENTFDGERCLYAAHNPEIKRLLREYRVLVRTDAYHDFLRRCFNNSSSYSDVQFEVRGKIYHAHRVILATRNHYFATMFNGRWKGRTVVKLSHPMISAHAFGVIVRFIYTGRMEFQVHHLDDCIRMCKQCKLDKVTDLLPALAKHKSGYDWVVYDEIDPSTSIVSAIQFRFARMLMKLVPVDVRLKLSQSGTLSIPLSHTVDNVIYEQSFWDICIEIDGQLFKVHKVFLCGRSDYFKVLLSSQFKETEGLRQSRDGEHQSVPIKSASPEVFAVVLEYLYSDQVTQMDNDIICDVLEASELFLLPGLKHVCINILLQNVEASNVFGMIQVAREFDTQRLEDECVEYIALNLEEIVNDYTEDFTNLVRENAASIKNRQERDSIPIVDEIKSCLDDFYGIYNLDDEDVLTDPYAVECMQEKMKRITILNTLLAKLDIRTFQKVRWNDLK